MGNTGPILSSQNMTLRVLMCSMLLNIFVLHPSDHVCFILSGIQYFHECESAAKKGGEDKESVEWAHQERRKNLGDDFDDFGLGKDVIEDDSGLSEEGLVSLIAAQTPLQEMVHA
jgi:hypothetical protein